MLMTFYSSIVTCVVAHESIGVIIIQSSYMSYPSLSKLHSMICNDLIGLLKGAVSWICVWQFSYTNALLHFRRPFLTFWSRVEHFHSFVTPLTAIIKLGKARTFYSITPIVFFWKKSHIYLAWSPSMVSKSCGKFHFWVNNPFNMKINYSRLYVTCKKYDHW